MTVYLPNDTAKNYDLNSIMYKIVDGKKVYFRVDKVEFYGFKSKNTHIKFTGKKI